MPAATVERFTLEQPGAGVRDFHKLDQDFSVAGQSSPIRLAGDVSVQVSGTATSFTGKLERSTRDPNSGPNWAPAAPTISGDLSAGIQAMILKEPTIAWWRLNISVLSGGTLQFNIAGLQA